MHYLHKVLMLAAATTAIVSTAPQAPSGVFVTHAVPDPDACAPEATSSSPPHVPREEDLTVIKWGFKKCWCDRRLNTDLTDAVTTAMVSNITSYADRKRIFAPGDWLVESRGEGDDAVLGFVINQTKRTRFELNEDRIKTWLTTMLGGACGLYTVGTSGSEWISDYDDGIYGAGYMLKKDWNPARPASIFEWNAEKC